MPLDRALSLSASKNSRPSARRVGAAPARDEAAYIPLFFKEDIFGVRAGIQYTPSCDDHILAWDFTF